MDKLFEMIKQNSYNDLENGTIVLGDVLELKFNDENSCIDIYKHKDLSDVDIEEYDFDADYLTTIYL